MSSSSTTQFISQLIPCFYSDHERTLIQTRQRKVPQLRYRVNWNLIKDQTTTCPFLKSTFVQSWLDEETEDWLRSKSNPSQVRQFASDVLTQFFGRTSGNGLTFRGEMFVFSQKMIQRLLMKRNGTLGVDSELGEDNSNDSNLVVPNSGIRNRYHIISSPAVMDEGEDSSTHHHHSSSNSHNNKNIIRKYETDHDGNGIADTKEEAESHHAFKKDNDSAIINIRKLLLLEDNKNVDNKNVESKLLDIGAGDGGVTKILAPFFNKVYTTEDNPVMRMRLNSTFGWNTCFSSAETSELLASTLVPNLNFDTITLLNVLDRCDKPLTLLKEIRLHLLSRKKKNSINTNNREEKNDCYSMTSPFLILAVVLPWCPFVENGNKQEQPSEVLPMQGGGFCRERATFESSLEKMAMNVLIPAGFKICSWTRVPYICEGDAANEYYCLDDALFVLEAV